MIVSLRTGFGVGMPFEQFDGEAAEPSEVLAEVAIKGATLVFAERHVADPMASARDSPPTADREVPQGAPRSTSDSTLQNSTANPAVPQPSTQTRSLRVARRQR